MHLKMGSTRALASADRRPAGRKEGVIRSLAGDLSERSVVGGEGANHRTRGRVHFPSRLDGYSQAAKQSL